MKGAGNKLEKARFPVNLLLATNIMLPGFRLPYKTRSRNTLINTIQKQKPNPAEIGRYIYKKKIPNLGQQECKIIKKSIAKIDAMYQDKNLAPQTLKVEIIQLYKSVVKKL